MSRGPCTFKQRDLTAAVKAMIAAGCEVVGAKIDSTGAIIVYAGKAGQGAEVGASLTEEIGKWSP